MVLVWILNFGTLLRVHSPCKSDPGVVSIEGKKGEFSFLENLPGKARVRDNGLTVLRSREYLHMVCDLRTF